MAHADDLQLGDFPLRGLSVQVTLAIAEAIFPGKWKPDARILTRPMSTSVS